MRVLYAGHSDDHEGLSRRVLTTDRRAGARGPVRQSLPLHRLSAYHRCGDANRETDAELIAMATRSFGAPIPRNEDARLLSGQALFVDDVELPGMLYAAFLRSNVAHARIRSIDVSAARACEGVVAVYTAADLGSYWAPGPLLVPPPPIKDTIFNQRTQVPLAKDKVRHVGEPLAVVLADSRYLAEDALGDIAVDIEPLPAVVDLEKAVAGSAASVHDDVASNVAAKVRQSRGNYAAARAQASR